MKAEKIHFKDNLPLKIEVHSISRFPIHWHEDITEIILPIKGSVDIKANFEEIHLNEGDFFFINNKTIHYIKSQEESIVLLFYVDLDYFEEQFPYIKYMFFRNSIYEDLLDKSEVDLETKEKFKVHFRNLLISIFAETINPSVSSHMYDKLIHKLVYQMIYEFNWLQLLKKDGDFISSVHLDRYHRIVKYIQENYDKKINLDDIVSREFITKTYFSHFWKNLSTYSFSERINYERVLKSEFLLLKNMTITEISDKCGFSDTKYYYRNFKKWYKCMPLEHKEKCYSYMSQGYKYKELEPSDVKQIFKDYMKRFFKLEDSLNQEGDFSSIINKYLYLKYYHTIHEKTLATDKYLIMDPFKYSTITDEGEINFNWTIMDLLINLVIDFKFILQIKLNTDNLEKDVNKYIDIFLENSINRYGIDVMRNCHFLIDYKDSLIFDNTEPIEKLLIHKLKDINISYYIEP